MTEAEIEQLESFLSANPTAGEEIKGTGGCRKLRFAGRGKGKRGGYRTITFYSGTDLPVFLITVFAKGDKVNLSRAERNALAGMTKELLRGHRRVATVGERK